MNLKLIGSSIRECRWSKEYSLEELAFQAGISANHLGQIERGEMNLTMKTLCKIITALDTSLSEVFNFCEPFTPVESPLAEKILTGLRELTPEQQKFIWQGVQLLQKKNRADDKNENAREVRDEESAL